MLGDAKRKIQRIVDLAEQLYEKVNELTRRVEDTTETVEDTNARIGDLESELAEQRALIEALAEERGLDVRDLTGADDPEDAGGTSTDGSDREDRSDEESAGA